MKPTVTEILSLLDKPGLMKWANKIGLEGIRLDEYRKKCLKGGLSLHRQIENYILKGLPFEDPLTQKRCMRFLGSVDVLDVENEVETDHYMGRYDIRYSRDSEIFIGDFKSSGGVYLENVLQLIAYSEAEDIDNIAIIEIPSFKEKIIKVDSRRPFIEILESLSNIHQMKEIAKWTS
jgi:hypothetical protein